MLKYDERTILSEAARLSVRHRVAFMASCCERLAPNYTAFAVCEGIANPRIIEGALNSVWMWLEGYPMSETELLPLSQSCEEQAIAVETSTSPFRTIAADAAAAVSYTLRGCLTNDVPWLAMLPGRPSTQSTPI